MAVDRDYENKRLRYEDAGVAEYWIIDPDERKVTFLVRGTEGFVEATRDAQVFRSRVIPQLAIDTRWLWRRPLPPTRPIVQQMLREA